MVLRRTVFQPDLEVELPEDEEAQLERDGLLLPLAAEAPRPSAGATVTAAAAVAPAPKEAATDGGK